MNWIGKWDRNWKAYIPIRVERGNGNDDDDCWCCCCWEMWLIEREKSKGWSREERRITKPLPLLCFEFFFFFFSSLFYYLFNFCSLFYFMYSFENLNFENIFWKSECYFLSWFSINKTTKNYGFKVYELFIHKLEYMNFSTN